MVVINGTLILCCWVPELPADGECDELATFWLDLGGGRSLETCDAHLADLVRGCEELYGVGPRVRELRADDG